MNRLFYYSLLLILVCNNTLSIFAKSDYNIDSEINTNISETNNIDEEANEESYEEEEEVTLKLSATRILTNEAKVLVSLDSIISSDLNAEGQYVQAKILVHQSVTDPAITALRGAVLQGYVHNAIPSRKAGRNGRVSVVFNNLKIPNSDINIPIHATMQSQKFKGSEGMKTIWGNTKHIARGTAWGALNSFRVAPVTAFATDGASVAIGAAVGMGLGAIGSFKRQGNTATYNTGTNQVININSGVSLTDEAIELTSMIAEHKYDHELDELNIGISSAQLKQHNDYIAAAYLTLNIANNSDKIVYAGDLILSPLNGDDPIVADLRLSGLDMTKSIKPGQAVHITLGYPLPDYAKFENYELVMLNPLDKTYLSHQPIVVVE